MPFGNTTADHTESYWTSHFKEFLKSIVEDVGGLRAVRSQPMRGDLVEDIIKQLVQSPIVVADLTDHNVNVYWELGVRHSFRFGTITIAEEGTKLGFDITTQSTLFYHPRSVAKTMAFRGQLIDLLDHCLAHPAHPDSHVLKAITGRGTLYEVQSRAESIRKLDALVRECTDAIASVNRCVVIAKKNAEKRGKNEGPDLGSQRCRLSCVELLVTTRYMDADEGFYKLAESALGQLQSTNEALNWWPHEPIMVEKWLVDDTAGLLATVADLHKAAVRRRQELASKV